MLNFKFMSQISKYKIAVATLLDNIVLARYNTNGTILKYIKIPVVFSQSNKLYDISNGTFIKNAMNSNNEVDVNFPLPHISITMGDLQIDPISMMNQNYLVDKENSIYTPTPTMTNFIINIITKSQTDTEMIVEQILPIFRSKASVNVNLSSTIKEEMILELESVDLNFPEEWQLEDLGLLESSITLTTNMPIYRFPRTLPTKLTVELDTIGNFNTTDTLSLIEDL